MDGETVLSLEAGSALGDLDEEAKKHAAIHEDPLRTGNPGIATGARNFSQDTLHSV